MKDRKKSATADATRALKALRVGGTIQIGSAGERVRYLQVAAVLREAGAVDYRLKTWVRSDGTYEGVAVS